MKELDAEIYIIKECEDSVYFLLGMGIFLLCTLNFPFRHFLTMPRDGGYFGAEENKDSSIILFILKKSYWIRQSKNISDCPDRDDRKAKASIYR